MNQWFGKIICKLKGKHRFTVTETWDSDAASYSPCLRCGVEKKHYRVGPDTDFAGNDIYRFEDGSMIVAHTKK